MQNYKNHIRYYPAHHFIFYPFALILIAFGIYRVVKNDADKNLWIAVLCVSVLMTSLSFMMRQHYALNNQNRIVRLELRFRYFEITGKRLEPFERQLNINQLAALRFASDEELEALVARSANENLSPDEIKKTIKNWLPDHMRV
jgi:hypothetical protein